MKFLRKGNPNSDLMELVVHILKMAVFTNKALLQEYRVFLSNIYDENLGKEKLYLAS